MPNKSVVHVGKWLRRKWGAVAVAVVVGTYTGLSSGQARPRQEAPPANPATQTATPDFTPLAKALGNLNRAQAFSYTGENEIKGAGSGITFAVTSVVSFTGQRPNNVRSEVQVRAGDAPARKYLTVSDGKKLWTHRPGMKQYGVVPLAKESLSESLTALGLLGSFYFNRDLIGGLGEITSENAPLVLSELKAKGLSLTIDSRDIAGVSTPVYVLNLPKEGLILRFIVDGATSTLSRLEMVAKTGGIELNVGEKITMQNAKPSVDKSAFVFAPPAGHKKVVGLEVSPL